jgi:hypothetical protein
MEIFLSGLESDVIVDIVGGRVTPPLKGAVSSLSGVSVSDFAKFIK